MQDRARRFSLFAVLFIALVAGRFSDPASGASISLTDAQQKRLAEIVKSDPQAGKLFDELRRSADAALKADPDPIARIQTEGKLPADPARLASQASLRDMGRLTALAYAVTGEAAYADKARQFILAWARVNRSAGDPIDDTSLEPALIAYDLTRSHYSPADRELVDAWLRDVVRQERASGKKSKNNRFNNWHSHRLKIIGLIAFILDDKPLIAWTERAFKEQIDRNLLPDGSSYDFHERDALHYHLYDLAPLLSLATAARNNGLDWYGYRSPEGASLGKSVAFVVPYADGSKTHAEFVHSKVSFDRKRAEAGDAHYKAGKPFEPKSAAGMLAQAELFDPALLKLVIQLDRPGARHYPTWQIVLNDARRP